MSYSAVDLFAGAGGLSLGFLQTGRYTVEAFVENNRFARETYVKNHPNTDVYENVIGLDYSRLLKKSTKIDVVIGGPPCQGFSNANRQRNQLINLNNQLVKEYVRVVCELKPKAFVMENVKMLKSDVHVFYYTEDDAESGIIDKYSIKLNDISLDLLADKFFSDDLADACSDLELLRSIRLSDKSFTILNNLHRYVKNQDKFKKTYLKYSKELKAICEELKSYTEPSVPEIIRRNYSQLSKEIRKYGETFDSEKLVSELTYAIPIQQMVKNIAELTDKKIQYELVFGKGIKEMVKSYSVSDYIKKILSSLEYNYKIAEGVLNAAEFGAPQKRQRFILIGVKDAGEIDVTLPAGTFNKSNFRTVKDAIGDLEDIPVHYDVSESPVSVEIPKLKAGSLQAELRDNYVISNHVATNTREVALKRFSVLKQSQNFHNLNTELKENTYTDTERTQNTIYQRLNYNEPSGTVLNVRKSMWIHPTIDRAISIREAARLQTFPDSYIFYGKKDAQYKQIGNAVPPILGKAIAEKITDMLDNLE
ncbi:DNA cytosine methyltransferase [uncultured Methanocorpusculum sp.]|nr:DNA cytosine methyltransferase [uncultured Methanocorpusculum sp.]